MTGFDFKKQAQDYYSRAPTIILGSGASAAHGVAGMARLGEHLLKDVLVDDLESDDEAEWHRFCDLINGGMDLESALHRASLTDELAKRVAFSTWNLISERDREIFKESLLDFSYFQLGVLLRSMFRSAQKEVDIITTNYDCLAEYACDQEGIHYFSGFSFGFRRSLVSSESIKVRQQANIWKVHGSLDWFEDEKKQVVAIGLQNDIPEMLTPLIVTPGVDKYRRTHLEPFRSVIQNADNAINNRSSYLCVGFGFNDEHIQPKLVARCSREKIPIVIITRDLTESARDFIFNSGLENYLAIERGGSDDQSIIYSSLSDKETRVDKDYWSLKGFLSMIL